MLTKISVALFLLFIGFASGRIGHFFGGFLYSPHHWIYGLILIIFGLITRKKYPRFFYLIIIFGVGLFISDLQDFLDLKFIGLDTKSKFIFWQID